jgi:type I restriction enzyme R subunit
MSLDEIDYDILLSRYKELFGGGDGGGGDVPFEIAPHLTEIDTGKIDADYMNSRFDKYLKVLQTGEEVEQVKSDLHRTFATPPHIKPSWGKFSEKKVRMLCLTGREI